MQRWWNWLLHWKYDENGKCLKCKEKCFLFENKYYKWNDKDFGNIRYIGEYDGTDYETKRNIICEENGCDDKYYIFKIFVIVVMFLMKIALDVVMKIKKF